MRSVSAQSQSVLKVCSEVSVQAQVALQDFRKLRELHCVSCIMFHCLGCMCCIKKANKVHFSQILELNCVMCIGELAYA